MQPIDGIHRKPQMMNVLLKSALFYCNSVGQCGETYQTIYSRNNKCKEVSLMCS